jgi:hypothetical protein
MARSWNGVVEHNGGDDEGPAMRYSRWGCCARGSELGRMLTEGMIGGTAAPANSAGVEKAPRGRHLHTGQQLMQAREGNRPQIRTLVRKVERMVLVTIGSLDIGI